MFLAPFFLFGLLATAIPLVLHLRKSTRHKKIVFSTTRFFDEQFIKSSRRARLQDRLLMALRIALLALFVLALAQPLIGVKGLAAWMTGKRNVAIIIDDSESMGLSDDKGLLLDRAKQAAVALVDGLSPTRGDRATVLLAGRREEGPRFLFPEPTTDLAAVRRAIEGVKLTDLATDLGSAIHAGGTAIGAVDRRNGVADAAAEHTTITSGSREVYVFSDMQRTAFAPEQKLYAGEGASIIFVASKARFDLARENISVDAVQYGAPQPMQNVPFTFRALLTNHGDRPRGAAVTLVVDGQAVSQKVIELAAGRSKIVRFSHRFAKPGWFRGYIEVGSPPAEAASAGETPAAGANPVGGIDSQPGDNRRYFALKVEERLKILAVNGAASSVALNDELFFLRLALTVNPESAVGRVVNARAIGGIQLDPIAPPNLTREKLDGYPLVILANVGSLSTEGIEALERYVDAGGNVLFTMGDRVDTKVYAQWSGENRLHGGLIPGTLRGLAVNTPPPAPPMTGDAPPLPGASDPPDAGFIAWIAEDHPIGAGFNDGQFGSLSSVRFTQRYLIETSPEAAIMRTAEGDPLLVEKRYGRGRSMLFTSSIDRDWTNFPLQSPFIPWLFRLVGYMAQGTLEGSGFVRTGQTVPLPASAAQVEAMKIELPDNTIAYPTPSRIAPTGNSPSGMVLANTETAGIYAVRPASQTGDTPPRLLFAANIPSDESDPVSLEKNSVGALIAGEVEGNWDYVDTADTTIESASLTRRGLGLWDHLLFVALAVGLLEPWFANRIARRRGVQGADALGQRDAVSPARAGRAAA